MKNELENLLEKYFNIIVNHNNFDVKNDNINYELEFLYYKNISFNNFTKIIAFLKNDNNNFIIDKNLNVSTFHNYNNLKDIRLIIKQTDIQNFYENELDFLNKNDASYYQEKIKIYNDNYNILNNFKLNLKLEKDVENNTISIYNTFYEIQVFKTYRYKNRISFNYDYFTIDITHVKYVDNNILKKSKQDDFNFNYELEVEINTKKIINYNISTKSFNIFMPSYKSFISSLINKLSIINNLLQDNLYNLDNNIEKEIIDNFKNLIQISKNNIIGPKPISLTFKDLNNLSKEYKITDKADGERFNLYINDKGYIYLLNNNRILNINRKTHDYKNTIIDGELITSYPIETLDVFNFTDINDINKINKQKNIKVYSFHAFDIYFYNSANLLQTNNDTGFNLEYRINKLEEVINNINNNPYNNKKDKITFHTKKYYSLSDYKNIHKTQYNYNLDGLILMPIEPISISNIDKIWLSNLKWKPKLLNTIDFKIKQITNNIYHLIAYYYCTKLHKKIDIHFQSTQPYIKNIHIINSEQQTLQTIINDEIITNNKIVECIYDITINKWVFLRIRHDKTFPNSLDVANKTFFNIFNTFKYKDILNIENISKSYKQFIENSYYNENENNHKNNYSTFYRKYQNIIKTLLINTFIPKINNIKILDIGCGRGGDLIKFMRSINKTDNIDLYLGLDINNNNITGQSNARERFINLTSKNNEFKKFNNNFYFITADINKIKQNPIKQLLTDLIITSDEIKNSYTQDFIQDIIINDTIYDKQIIQQTINDDTKFDFINCQFMIHYINDLSLFFKLVTDLLTDNGVIVITYIDSNILDTRIQQTTKVNDLTNIQNLLHHENINLNNIYQDDFQTIVKSNDNLSYYVKLNSTNSFIKENIINDQILTNALKDSGLTSINEKAHQTFNQIKNINNTQLKSINLKFKKQIQDFSNINTSLVLKKYNSNVSYKNQLEFINHILTL